MSNVANIYTHTRWRITVSVEHDDMLSDAEIAAAIERDLGCKSLVFGKRTGRSRFGCRAQIDRVEQVRRLPPKKESRRHEQRR